MVETSDGSFYGDGEILVPRVSDIVAIEPAPELDMWKQIHGEMAEVMAQRASDFHDLTAAWDLGRTPRPPGEDEAAMLCAWHMVCADAVIEFLMIERNIMGPEIGVGGRLDRLVMMVGEELPAIWDIKTGKLVESTGWQLAGYALILGEMGIKVGRRIAVNIPFRNPGTFRVKDYDKEKDFDKFLELRGKYYGNKE